MPDTISNSLIPSMSVKALWHRLIDSLAIRLEERCAQAQLALMTPHDRFDLGIAQVIPTGSKLVDMTQRRETGPTGIPAELRSRITDG
ncbi:hypothetical protein SAE02_32970 [Skermanella aerolata]|uniref:Uncharacterized protein n=1 Tax=Skermanella aerolata TaxID=393310 RepID=A0A512DRN0_9PROT|nr:hypothetical protein [Skermanella aerolata]KJB93249.1 hypothetical protein N826_16655 [Skermanella aerolata KACC 11604]GEO39149.1 hypothetical protein SAE02_32970 [Skermanella aerolata]